MWGAIYRGHFSRLVQIRLFKRPFSKLESRGKLRQFLEASFGKHLLLTNIVSSAGLLFVGDALQQRLEILSSTKSESEQEFNWERSLRMFLVGLSQGPPHHYWYLWLDKVLPGKALVTVGKKVLADQIFAAPFFAITFIFFASLLEGRSMAECWVEFKSKFPTIYLFDWLIWPPTQVINFTLIPAQFRVFYVNVITVVWDIFLSYIKHTDT